MSIVVALKDKDRFWLAADSQVTVGGTKDTISHRHSYKIFNNFLSIVGSVGYLRDINIISTMDSSLIPERNLLTNTVSFNTIVRDVVPNLFEELNNNGRLIKTEDGLLMAASEFIIAYQDQCYQIFQDGTVIEVVDMAAIGSGGYVAENANLILKDVADDSMSIIERLIKLVEASFKKDVYVNYPIIITDTIDQVYFIYNENGSFGYYDDEDGIIKYEEDEEEVEEDGESEEEDIEQKETDHTGEKETAKGK